MGEYAAFLLILVLGFACGYGTARARGEREGEPGTLPEPTRPSPPMPEVKPPKTEMTERDRFVLELEKCGYSDLEIIQILARDGDKRSQDFLRRRDDNRRTESTGGAMAVSNDKLLKALRSLLYKSDGQWCVRIIGDCSVSGMLDKEVIAALDEAYTSDGKQGWQIREE